MKNIVTGAKSGRMGHVRKP